MLTLHPPQPLTLHISMLLSKSNQVHIVKWVCHDTASLQIDLLPISFSFCFLLFKIPPKNNVRTQDCAIKKHLSFHIMHIISLCCKSNSVGQYFSSIGLHCASFSKDAGRKFASLTNMEESRRRTLTYQHKMRNSYLKDRLCTSVTWMWLGSEKSDMDQKTELNIIIWI